jgi:hypothetical protein
MTCVPYSKPPTEKLPWRSSDASRWIQLFLDVQMPELDGYEHNLREFSRSILHMLATRSEAGRYIDPPS